MKLEQKLKENYTLISLEKSLDLKESKIQCILTGGAIIDILEGREPKDYDFIFHESLKKAIESSADFEYISVSNTSLTYLFQGKKIIQLLFRDINSFEYTISQVTYDLREEKLEIDMISFTQKVLIPTKNILPQKPTTLSQQLSEEAEKYQVYDALRRIPHYKRKGYNLPDMTYETLLSKLYKYSKDESYS